MRVHHLVVEMLRCPFAGVDDSPPAILLAEVEQPEHRLVSHICRLGYRLLQLMVCHEGGGGSLDHCEVCDLLPQLYAPHSGLLCMWAPMLKPPFLV